MDQLLEEILAQPQAIRDTMGDLLGAQWTTLERLRDVAQEQPRRFDGVVLTGMGSSFYALPIASIALQQAGIPCVVTEASELLHYQLGVLSARALLVVVSQSGESVEIVRLVEQVCRRGADKRPTLISVTSNLDNSLARAADIPLRIRAGDERSIAIKTHTCTQAALGLIGAAIRGVDLEEHAGAVGRASTQLKVLLDSWEERLDPLFAHFEGTTNPFLLGRGWSQVSAAAGALALKEGGHVAAEGMSVGAFRHGTLELAGPGIDVMIFAADPATAGLNLRLADDLAGYGARVALAGSNIKSGPDVFVLELPPVEPELAPLLEVPVAQLWSRQLAITQGRTPGELLRLPKVIRVE